MKEEERKQVVKHLLKFLSELRTKGREYVSLEVEKVTPWKLENISLELDLDLQTHGWKADLLQLTKGIKFLQVITAVFVNGYLFNPFPICPENTHKWRLHLQHLPRDKSQLQS